MFIPKIAPSLRGLWLIGGVFTLGLSVFVPGAASAEEGLITQPEEASAEEGLITQPEDAFVEEGLITHESTGCDGAVVLTPRQGAEMNAEALGLPASAKGFYAEASKRGVTWLSTMECSSTGRSHRLDPSETLVEGGEENSTASSKNWSGYAVRHQANFVSGDWKIPAVSAPRPSYSTTGYASSIWTGIGGDGPKGVHGALIQAGTSEYISSNGTPSYYFWYEIVGGIGDTTHEKRISLPAHPGDSVSSRSSFSNGWAYMTVCNNTLNQCLSFKLASSAPGPTAEWIVEDPTGSSGYDKLVDFGSVTFSKACWASVYKLGSPCSPITDSSWTSISLGQTVLGGFHVLAAPGALDVCGDGFTDTYHEP